MYRYTTPYRSAKTLLRALTDGNRRRSIVYLRVRVCTAAAPEGRLTGYAIEETGEGDCVCHTAGVCVRVVPQAGAACGPV